LRNLAHAAPEWSDIDVESKIPYRIPRTRSSEQEDTMRRAARLRTLAIALIGLFAAAPPSGAGTITFGGDLAGALSPIATPTTIAAGGMPDFAFDSGSVANVGQVSGDVVFSNNSDATAGSITITNLSFVSSAPLGAGPVSFTVAISQDFDYNGLPHVLGSESLGGAYTFTAFPQSGLASTTSDVSSVALEPFLALGSSSAGAFPQSVPINPSPPPGTLVAASNPLHLDLFLGITLSDNALGSGPSAVISDASVSYVSAIPEPSTWVLVLTGTLALAAAATLRAVAAPFEVDRPH
jgi:hypothetical protein